MKISIIITYYNGIKILQTNLENLYLSLKKSDFEYEIIIVNDNPSNKIDLHLTKYKNVLPLSIINMPENGGYVKACHYGIENSANDYIVLMDSDIIPCLNWLDNMIITYKNNNYQGSVSATILEMDNNNLFSYGIGIHGVDLILFKRHGKPSKFNSKDKDFYMVSSGCILFSKQLYYQLSGQDDMFMNADNDLDFTFRISQLGYKNTMCHNAFVFHRGHVSGKIRSSSFRMDSKAYLFKKWGNQLEQNTMNTLKELYLEHPINNKQIILVSLSNSLYRRDYIDLFIKLHNLKPIKYMDLKNPNALETINLNDILDWDLCQLEIPILYFVDNYHILENNYFWFVNRPITDIIFDKNGNVEQVSISYK